MSETNYSEPHHPRPQWKSRTGFILAAIGSAVGLGNIWRFSYLCYKNGGGAFLIPYTIALLVVGIPLMILELGVGHKMRGSAPMSFAKVHPKWEWLGWWAVICAMYGIMLYYSVVIAWCVSYMFFSFNLSWGNDPNAFFYNEFLQLSQGPLDIGDMRTPILTALLSVWAMSWGIVFFGVQKGVERANKIFMPLLLILMIVLVGWSVSLEGAAQGIAVYLTPDFSKLGNLQIWIDAFSQIFFTLSLAFGIMIVYASYLPKKVDIVKDACIICFSNSAFSIFAGFSVFGTLGYMAHATQQPIDEVVTKSIGLAFVTYPQAISLIPTFSKVFGVVFFSSLVIAGLSSAISLIEAFSSAIVDKFHFKRSSVVSVVCLTGFLGSMIFSSKAGLYWVDIVDQFVTHYGLVIIALLECVAVGWVFQSQKLRKHIDSAGNTKLSPIWDSCIRFIIPAVLIILLLNDLKAEIAAPYEGYSRVATLMIGRDWLIFALIASLLIFLQPWKKELKTE